MQNLKKSIRVRVLVLGLVIGLPLQMCSPEASDDCNCSPITGSYFDIKGMEMSNYRKIDENSVKRMLENEAVPYSEYEGLSVEYQVDYISHRSHAQPSFSMINSAYACSCVYDGYAGSKNEKLTNISVITLNDFDENHKANDTINDLIIVKGYYFQENEYLQDYLIKDTTNIKFQGIQLLVDRKPTLNENYKVKVVVELSTGEIYQDVSESIIIK